MRTVASILALALVFAGSARADEAPPAQAPTPPAPAQDPKPPQTHILSEKEMVDDDGYVVRLSLPTEEDVALWSKPGIRIGLGFSYSRMLGRSPAISFDTYGFAVRALSRIDRSWAVGVEFLYAAARSTPLTGLRYEGTFHAIAYPWQQLALDVGLGFGGLLVTPPRGRAQNPDVPGVVADVTVGPDKTLGSCDGAGWVGLARAEYQFIAGPMFASGPYVEISGQYTRCQQQLGRQDRETGNPINASQYWLHRNGGVGWWLTWR